MEEQVRKRRRRRRRKKNKRKGNIVSNLILVLALAIFLFSGYKLYTIYSEYHKGDEEYESIVNEVVIIEPSEDMDKSEAETQMVFKVDFETLQSINKEVVGWIRFDNPEKISYPIVQGSDNEKYLTKTVEGKKNSSGSIFMDASNSADFTDKNTFIYGHNMKNGSMFGQLRKYKNIDFYKENPYFYIYTPDGKEVKYQIYAVCIVEDTSESYNKFYADDAAYLEYLKYIKSISRYDTGVEVTASSQLVSLSTCTNVSETQRMIVHGVKVEELAPEGQAEKTPVEEATGE